MARAKQPPRGTTKEEASVKVEDETEAPTENEAPIETADAGPAEIVGEVVAGVAVPPGIEVAAASVVAERVEAPVIVEDETRSAPELFQELLPSVAAATEIPTTSFQVIFGEVTDYSRRSLENGSAFVRKLLGARSLESAILIQSEYAKTSYVDFVAHMTKIGNLYSTLATEVLERRSRVA